MNLAQGRAEQGSHGAGEVASDLQEQFVQRMMSCCIACLADSERQLKHGIWKLFSLMNQTLHMSYLSLYANTMPVTQWENLLWVIHYGRLICFLFQSFYLGQIINVLNVKAEEE